MKELISLCEQCYDILINKKITLDLYYADPVKVIEFVQKWLFDKESENKATLTYSGICYTDRCLCSCCRTTAFDTYYEMIFKFH